MHSDHDIFIQGIQQKKKLRLTFLSEKNPKNLPRQCAPLHYSKGRIEGDNLDCYYFWDLEAAQGSHFLALLPSQISRMELSEGTFKIGDFSDFRRTTDDLAKSSVT
ncbi:MAG: hypothetical protein RQ760_07555 [Sedimentisphaerales bacterium]|nr:hypothetical protein [Sedimentisphaerales bacterium]